MSFDREDYRGAYILGTAILGAITVLSFFSQLTFLEETSLPAIYATLIVVQVSIILAYYSFDVVLDLLN